MPMSQLEKDYLSRQFAVCKQLLNDLQPKLQSLNELYSSVGGISETLSQAELDELPELSGLQKTTVDDAQYALSGMATSITNASAALQQCGARFL